MLDTPANRLILRVASGNVKKAKALIDQYGVLDARIDSYGHKSVCYSLRNHLPDVKRLMSKIGAKVKNIRCICSPLIQLAAEVGNTEMVRMLLDSNVDVNLSSELNRSYCHAAVDGNSLEILKLFLQRNVRIDGRTHLGKTPLLVALDRNNIDIVKELINHGLRTNEVNITEWIDDKCTQLHLAVLQDNDVKVNLLLTRGDEVDAKMTDCKTPLHIATILSKGEKINSKDTLDSNEHQKMILSDGQIKNLAIVKMLIDGGADVNATELYGITPLHNACKAGNVEIVKILIERNADIHALDNSLSTPLHYAAGNNIPEIVEILLNLGVPIDAVNDDYLTPLYLAVAIGAFATVKILLDYGADVNAASNEYTNPFKCLTSNNFGRTLYPEQKNMVEFLEQYILTMIARNIYVSDINIQSIKIYYKSVYRIISDPIIETTNMKNKIYADSNVTYCDLITADLQQLVKYAGNKNILDAIKSVNLKKNFPIYSKMIIRRMEEAEIRKNLFGPSHESIYALSGYFLPDIAANETFKHLSIEDLENLKLAVTSDDDSDDT